MRRAMIAAFSAATLVFSGPAAADEIEDSISEALSAYRNNDYSAAKQALDYASQLIAQKNAEGLAAVLPEALSGWTAEDVETQEAAAAMFGGIWAARTYEKGGVAVKVQIMGDFALARDLDADDEQFSRRCSHGQNDEDRQTPRPADQGRSGHHGGRQSISSDDRGLCLDGGQDGLRGGDRLRHTRDVLKAQVGSRIACNQLSQVS